MLLWYRVEAPGAGLIRSVDITGGIDPVTRSSEQEEPTLVYISDREVTVLKVRSRGFSILLMVLVLTVFSLVSVVLPGALARDGEPGGFEANDFEVITSKPGFGDHRNSYAWSVRRFKGDLYVGTGRCPISSVTALEPVPKHWCRPADPALNPAQYKRDMSGEIWRLSDGGWERVYKDPLDDEIYIGFREMIVFKDKLYAAPASSPLNPNLTGNPPILYRTSNGTDWSPVNEDGLPTEASNSTRMMMVHDGRLYVGIEEPGDGKRLRLGKAVNTDAALYSTKNPANGWTKVAEFPSSSGITSMEVFKNQFYVGTQNLSTGFEIFKSPLDDLKNWTKVVDSGAGDGENVYAGSMAVFKGHLYVGSMCKPLIDYKGFDLIRLDGRGHWDLVVGSYPVGVDKPNRVTPERGWPISGRRQGMGKRQNWYAWTLDVHDGILYLGTLGAETIWMDHDDEVQPDEGADFWKTENGTDWTPVTENGFGNEANFGIRNVLDFEPAPGKKSVMYVGTATHARGSGLEVLRATPD